ncbi:hypothetical protein OROMI_032560 [Orobanche minor]
MSSEISDPVGDRVKVSMSKKSPGKAPRKIHKAAREKLKRDHMNELFLDLGKTLDLDHLDYGKASILRETIRLVGELVSQVECLKNENEALLSESSYVTTERNELLDETSTLDAQVKILRKQIHERVNCADFDSFEAPSDGFTTKSTEDHVAFPLAGHASDPTPVVGPLFVMPLQHESQVFSAPFPEVNIPKVPSSVSRPRPRYPSAADSWPCHVLTEETNVVEDV